MKKEFEQNGNEALNKTDVMGSVDFETFKNEFLYPFIFRPIERPNFNEFIKVHYKVYIIIYKTIFSIKKYSEIAIKENIIEFETLGIELKKEAEKKRDLKNES